MNHTNVIPIRVYKEFMARDWPALPVEAQDSLSKLLMTLQKDPDSPEITSLAQRDPSGQLGYEFSPGYLVYWRVVRDTSIYPSVPGQIEILAIIKSGIEFSEQRANAADAERSTPEVKDILRRVYTRNGSTGNLSMWASLHVSQQTGKVKGWIANSWSTGGPPHLHPKIHWVSFPDYKFYHMQLRVDFNSSIEVGPEDIDIEPNRLFFVHSKLREWESDWIAEKPGADPSQ
jgi:hypothetical protein